VPRDGRFEEGFKGRPYVFSPSQVDVIGRDAQEMPGWPVERASDVAVVRADGTVFMGLRIPASDGSATGRLDVTVIDWRGSQIALGTRLRPGGCEPSGFRRAVPVGPASHQFE
jgi:hypothetical protein